MQTIADLAPRSDSHSFHFCEAALTTAPAAACALTLDSRAAALAADLRANAHAYHDGTISHEVFTAGNRAIWAQIETAGKSVHDAVRAILRTPGGQRSTTGGGCRSTSGR